jgi:hypothetical protein
MLEFYEKECFKNKTGMAVVHIPHEIKKANLLAERKELIKNSGIDFSKFGWAAKVARLLGIARNNASKYIREHLPEFYEKECFKK